MVLRRSFLPILKAFFSPSVKRTLYPRASFIGHAVAPLQARSALKHDVLLTLVSYTTATYKQSAMSNPSVMYLPLANQSRYQNPATIEATARLPRAMWPRILIRYSKFSDDLGPLTLQDLSPLNACTLYAIRCHLGSTPLGRHQIL